MLLVWSCSVCFGWRDWRKCLKGCGLCSLLYARPVNARCSEKCQVDNGLFRGMWKAKLHQCVAVRFQTLLSTNLCGFCLWGLQSIALPRAFGPGDAASRCFGNPSHLKERGFRTERGFTPVRRSCLGRESLGLGTCPH